MQSRKWLHYLRERKPRHLRVNGSSGPETPLGCMALMQTTSPQGERGALGLVSALGRITHAAIQTETHLPYLHPDHDQYNPPMFQRGATTLEESRSDPPVPRGGDTHFPPRKKYDPDHHFSLARSWTKGKRFLASTERNRHEYPHQTLPPKTHTQDLRLFRCELSKVV